MDLQLEGKRALVTGGSRGIGKAIARVLACEGAQVAIAARDPARLAAAAGEISAAAGTEVATVQYEAGDDESARNMVASAAEALAGIDILVNNAAQPGGTAPPNLGAVTTTDFSTDMNVKVMGYLRCAQHAAPLMAANHWGRIINIGGLTAYTTVSMLSSMRVIAVASLTKNLADQLGPSGITVNLVHPGSTRTERTTDEQAARAGRNVIGRMVDAEEVAWLVAFLSSPRSGSITGESIGCGGGIPGTIRY
ncbi:MAG: SDR family oxidoreductase [Actinobacteria bacterium]|nr:SDR family oxidoreductase [Actinomycetota bacterium]MBO0835824.1 SDR family oxidoreductase [Actinomycetota bacterium]